MKTAVVGVVAIDEFKHFKFFQGADLDEVRFSDPDNNPYDNYGDSGHDFPSPLGRRLNIKVGEKKSVVIVMEVLSE